MSLFLSRRFADRYGEQVRGIERAAGVELEWVLVPDDPDARVLPEQRARIEIAFFDQSVFPDLARPFFSAVLGAAKLRWLHVFSAGVDHPVFRGIVEKGVLMTSSPGANAKPIGRSAITGLLMLARGFPFYLANQRERRWQTWPHARPVDLDDQTLVVLGLGGIGSEIARLGKALGLHTIGVRRSPRRDSDFVDELCTPADLPRVLSRADWLAIACPLTDETRRLIDGAALDALPDGARVLNVGRGEIIDEAALIERLHSGRIAGAYLDVFEVEPLPESSPLWEMPNVIVTPHDSSISAGTFDRTAPYFLTNLERWLAKEPLAGVAE